MREPANDATDPKSLGQVSHLQQLWSNGSFALTAQLPPLLTAEAGSFVRQVAARARGLDAIMAGEAPAGAIAVSSLAMAVLFKRAGMETVVQLSGRDRNRLALQGDLLGLGALGLPNLLIDMRPITRASLTQHPDARLVGDLDGPALLATAVSMRDEARFMSGASMKTPPQLYIGALCSPEADSPLSAWNAAQFIVTPPIEGAQRFAAALRAFQAAHPNFLQTRPLVVSFAVDADGKDQKAASADEMREAALHQMLVSLERLKGPGGIRGLNLVISDLAALALLERLVQSAGARIAGREQQV